MDGRQSACAIRVKQRSGRKRAVFHLAATNLATLLSTYGYVAVLVLVAAESSGIPVPGETMLLTAAVYAATTNRLSIVGVFVAAAAGAIIGDNIGFWVGREGGYRLLRGIGNRTKLDQRKLKLAQYLFLVHGGKVVFFGRFVAVLRAWSAFLAGSNCMPWPTFLKYNAAGGVLWAALYSAGGYFFGSAFQRIARPAAVVLFIAAVVAVVAGLFFIRTMEQRLEEEAERVIPGPVFPPRRAAGDGEMSARSPSVAEKRP